MKTIFYKGEDISLTFNSDSDLSGYDKVIRFFTPFSEIKTAVVTPVDNNQFIAILSDEDTKDLKPGPLNIVVEFISQASGAKLISKTISARLEDPEVNGGVRSYAPDIESDIVFVPGIELAITLTGESELSILVTAHKSDKNNPHAVTKSQVGLGNVDNTSDNDKPISSATQQALNSKADDSHLTEHKQDTSNPHSVTKNQVGLSNADNTSDLNKPISNAAQAALNLKADLVGGKVPINQLPDTVLGQMEYISIWNAGSNTPIIPPASSSNKGHYYIVSVAGNTDIDGISDWNVGDWIASNGSTWDKIDNTDSVSSVNGKTGAVELTKQDIGLSNVDNTSDEDKPVSTAQQSALDSKSDTTHNHDAAYEPKNANIQAHIIAQNNPHGVTKAQVGLGDVDNTSDSDKPVSTAQQAALDLKADLVAGKVPSSQLPSYVDDILEYPNAASFPPEGEQGKIYVALDMNQIYRWGGSSYVNLWGNLALGETSGTAYRGDRGKIAYDHSQTPHNYDPSGSAAAVQNELTQLIQGCICYVLAKYQKRVTDDGGTLNDNYSTKNTLKSLDDLNVFDRASLVHVAGGLKVGKAYSIVPQSGDGDFTITRSGVTAMDQKSTGYWQPAVANKPRLSWVGGMPLMIIENAATNLISSYKSFAHTDWNKSGSSILGNPATAGAEIITNGSFDTNVSGWYSLNGNVDWNPGGYADLTGSGGAAQILYQVNRVFSAGLKIVSFKVKSSSYSGLIRVSLDGGSTYTYSTQNVSTDWTTITIQIYTTSSTSSAYYRTANPSTDIISFDDISIKDIRGFTCPFVDVSGNNTLQGYKLIESTASAIHRIESAQISVSSTSQDYTVSCFAKKSERSYMILVLLGASLTDRAEATFNLDTGVISLGALNNGAFTNAVAKIEQSVDGYYRCSITSKNDTTSIVRSYIYVANSSVRLASASFQGDGISGILISQAQLEAGSAATSPIAGTEGSTQTRNADVVVKAGIASLIGQSEGTILAELYITNYLQLATFITLSKTIGDAIRIRKTSTGFTVLITYAGSTTFSKSISFSNTGVVKVAFAYKNGDFAIAINGSLTSYTDAQTIPQTEDINIGRRNDGTEYFNNLVKNIHIDKTRLSNAQLVTLTTL